MVSLHLHRHKYAYKQYLAGVNMLCYVSQDKVGGWALSESYNGYILSDSKMAKYSVASYSFFLS